MPAVTRESLLEKKNQLAQRTKDRKNFLDKAKQYLSDNKKEDSNSLARKASECIFGFFSTPSPKEPVFENTDQAIQYHLLQFEKDRIYNSILLFRHQNKQEGLEFYSDIEKEQARKLTDIALDIQRSPEVTYSNIAWIYANKKKPILGKLRLILWRNFRDGELLESTMPIKKTYEDFIKTCESQDLMEQMTVSQELMSLKK